MAPKEDPLSKVARPLGEGVVVCLSLMAVSFAYSSVVSPLNIASPKVIRLLGFCALVAYNCVVEPNKSILPSLFAISGIALLAPTNFATQVYFLVIIPLGHLIVSLTRKI